MAAQGFVISANHHIGRRGKMRGGEAVAVWVWRWGGNGGEAGALEGWALG